MRDTIYIATQTINDIQNASGSMATKDWMGAIALFLSAIIAVLIGQYLQDRKAKKDRLYYNKFHVFATILGNRHSMGFNENFVITINQIPIVFNDNKKVMTSLDKYIVNHKDRVTPKDVVLKNMDANLNDLVLAMASDLGYPNINSDLMLNAFYPDASYFHHNSKNLYDQIYTMENTKRATDLQEQAKKESEQKAKE